MQRMNGPMIVRTVCLFTDHASAGSVERLQELASRLAGRGFSIQTTRLCCPDVDSVFELDRLGDGGIASSPYFPSAAYERNGFAVGLQPTNLSAGCSTIEEWLERLEAVWGEVEQAVGDAEDYLGIDTSIAPLSAGEGSFVGFLKRIGLPLERAATSDALIRISNHIRAPTVKSVGLRGLMFACLEDFDLAAEYDQGRFPMEHCLYLALHSGLGIDSYPIGVDEDSQRVVEILRCAQGLSNKHRKPLSARFISDGRARIGERTRLSSPYLTDVTIRPL